MFLTASLEAQQGPTVKLDSHSLTRALDQVDQTDIDARREVYYNHLYEAEVQFPNGDVVMLRDVLQDAVESIETTDKTDAEVRAELMKMITPYLNMRLEGGGTLGNLLPAGEIIQSEEFTPAFCNPDDPLCNCTDPLMCPISPPPPILPPVSHYEQSVSFRAWYIFLTLLRVEFSGKVVQVHENGDKQPFSADFITLHVGEIPNLAHCGWDLDDFDRGFVSVSNAWRASTDYTAWAGLGLKHFKMTWRFRDDLFNQWSLPDISERHCTFNWVFNKRQVR